MQAKDSRIATGGNNLEKRMTRAGGIVPLVILDLETTQKADRVIAARGPVRKLCRGSEARDNVRINRFLKDHQIRRGGNNRFRQCPFPTASAKANVVAQYLQRHAFPPAGTTT